MRESNFLGRGKGLASIKLLTVLSMLLLIMLLALGCGNISSNPSSTTNTGPQPGDMATAKAKSTTENKDQATAVTRPGYEPMEEVLVTQDNPSLPAGCRPEQVAGLVTNFFDAFNRGDHERLSGFFPLKAERVSWLYSVNEGNPEKGGRTFSTDNRDELLRYFSERHVHDERLQLQKVRISESGQPQADEKDIVNIVFTLTREADDLKPGLKGPKRIAAGKGVVACKEQEIAVWSMETFSAEDEGSRPPSVPCSEPSGWKPGAAVVACAS